MEHTQSAWLTLLTHAPAEDVKSLAEDVLGVLGEITVINNRTGLVMQPYTDSAEGTAFHLGEVLVAEAHIRLESGVEGYGLVTGRDTVFAMGVAVLDAALQSGISLDMIEPFLAAQHEAQRVADEQLLRQVEATRVEMETF